MDQFFGPTDCVPVMQNILLGTEICNLKWISVAECLIILFVFQFYFFFVYCLLTNTFIFSCHLSLPAHSFSPSTCERSSSSGRVLPLLQGRSWEASTRSRYTLKNRADNEEERACRWWAPLSDFPQTPIWVWCFGLIWVSLLLKMGMRKILILFWYSMGKQRNGKKKLVFYLLGWMGVWEKFSFWLLFCLLKLGLWNCLPLRIK